MDPPVEQLVVIGLRRGYGVEIINWNGEMSVLWTAKHRSAHDRAKAIEVGSRAFFWVDCNCGECSDWLSF